MAALLEDEKEFKTRHRIPALTQNHPGFLPDGRYWRGGVWASTNYMALKGLAKYGYRSLAHRIGKEHLQAVVDIYKKENTLFECYAPTGDGASTTAKGNPVRRDFVGWTGLPPIAILFEFVFGIRADVPNNKIVWDLHLTEKHGICNYPFGQNGTLTLLCEKRANENEAPKITVESNIPVTLEIIWGNGQKIVIN